MKETSRQTYGETTRGFVTVITFAGGPDDSGAPTKARYEVRHGTQTVGAFASEKDAETTARALVKAT